MSTIWGFNHIRNKHTLYLEQECMKRSSTSLRENTKYVIDFGKKCYR